jgi:hypothetical protein
MESLLPEFTKIILDENGTTLAKNGNTISPENIIKILPSDSSSLYTKDKKEDVFRLFSPGGELVALARKITNKNELHPYLVMETQDTPKKTSSGS